MLTLDTHITLDQEAIDSPNLATRFSQKDLQAIGNAVWDGYQADKQSRSKWEQRTESAMDLAMQIQKEKTFPWPNCSNVNFPLITIAVMQFHARAYPALIAGTDVVKCRVVGEDKTGEASERAYRVSSHMSWQVMEQDESWEEQHDRLLINVATVGSAFVKTYRHAGKGHNISELVLAKNLVLNYWAKSVEECPRKTHEFCLSRNAIHERIVRGVFCDVREEGWYDSPTPPETTTQSTRANNRDGVRQPQTDATTPYPCLEQHVSFDFDGDGYEEPYIVTIEKTSRQVLRIVTRFENESAIEKVLHGPDKGTIISIKPVEYFTKYPFIPSPDGGIYDIGFGVLAGPLNETVNSLTNQLVDAGSMSNSAGGFLGRGMKIRGGEYGFSPFEWKRVDSTGEDIHKSIFPLPVREPSNVLFQLLSLLIDYTNRISGSTDMMVGENPGQNTPAETSRTMVEQGAKIYTALFKRIWRSMKEEFQKLYILNGLYLATKENFGANGGYILREDYLGDPRSIVPVADPHVTSETQKFQQAQALMQAAMTIPGFDRTEVTKRYLQALHVDGIDKVFPGPDKTPPLPNPKVQVEQMKADVKAKQLELDKMKFVMQLQEDAKVNAAKILELQAKASLEMEQAGGVRAGHELAAFEAAIGALKVHQEGMLKQIELFMKGMESERDQGGGLPGMAGASGNAGSSSNNDGQSGGSAGPA